MKPNSLTDALIISSFMKFGKLFFEKSGESIFMNGKKINVVENITIDIPYEEIKEQKQINGAS